MNLGIYKWSTLNRFASADTIVPDPANPQSFNRYSYGYNNPVKYIDPSGHIPCELIPSECQIDSTGKETWDMGNYVTEEWFETGAKVAISAIEAVLQETSLLDIASGNVEMPSWSATSLYPDYVIIQGTAGPFSISGTMDTYSNIYVSGGLACGAECLVLAGFSGRISAGYIIGERNAKGYGPLIELNRNGTPTEAQLESLNRGVSFGGGIGGGIPQTAFIGPGIDVVTSVSNSPRHLPIAVEPGIYTPQLGIGVNFTLLFWDASDSGYDFKWPWE